MAVSFNRIPDNLRLRLYWAEMDPSKAGTFTNNRRALVLGHGTGTAADNTLYRASSAAKMQVLSGRGSMLDRMIYAGRKANGFDDIWMIDVPEPSAGVKASGTLTLTGPATAAGTLVLYVAGQKLAIKVASGDSAAAIATKVNTAINAALDLPVTSTVAAAVVTLTCRWKGASGNDIDIRCNYRGALGEEAFPAGVGATVVAMSGGTGVPDLSAAIAATGDQDFETIIHCWTDSASLDAIDEAWGDGDDGRWGWQHILYNHI